ncbi:hypothetical protein [Massilia sp. MS-15]|nr:hypothetical protein [Massilia sp. MS-15]
MTRILLLGATEAARLPGTPAAILPPSGNPVPCETRNDALRDA